MAADPEPGDGVIVHDAQGPVTKCYADRPDIFGLVDALETQGRMERVFRPETKRLFREIGGHFPDFRKEKWR